VTETSYAVFLDRLDERRRVEAHAVPKLAALLAERISQAQQTWPKVSVPPERFLSHLATRLPEGWPLERALTELRIPDLYLACACADGDGAALQAFDAAYLPEARRSLARLRTATVPVDDLAQMLREKLFVSPAGAPGIVKYSGRGSLRNWVRVLLTHLLVDLGRERQRRAEAPLETSDELDIPVVPDIEVDYLKISYRAEFKAAFAAATRGLSSRQRNLLRQQLLFGVSVEQIATLHSVHRATASRWLAEAREQLYLGTRRELEQRLDLDPSEFESLLRLVRSQIEVSLERLLAPSQRSP
jgi:RNA polymerase sigma-70 factor (ECF subfamily)